MSELVITAGGGQPFFGYLGDGDTKFFGQEFVSLGTSLGELTFYPDIAGEAGPVTLRVLVVSLQANDKVDQVLFTSNAMTIDYIAGESLAYASAGEFRTVAVDLGDTAVVSGQRYGLVWEYLPADSSDGTIMFAANASGGYAGGDLTYSFGSSLSSLNFTSHNFDIALRLTFDAASNAAPTAPALADRQSFEDVPVNFQIAAFTDPDGDPLSYSAKMESGSQLPGWLSFDAATRTFSGTPPTNFNGVLAIKVTATDGLLTASDTFNLIIEPVNDAPVAPALADRTVAEDTPVNFQVAAFSDAEGSSLTYSASLADGSALPAWLSFDTATRTFSGTPPTDFNGVIALKVTATDGLAGASDAFDLTITPVNDAPAAPGLPDRTWFEDVPVNLQVAAFSDVDGDVLTYSATLGDGTPLPAWLSFDAASRTFSGTPPANYSGVLALKVTASDGLASASDTFDLTISPMNDAPAAPGLTDQTFAEDTAVNFQIAAFTDADGDALTYSATLDDGAALPAWLVFDPATRTFAGAPPANFNGVISIKVTATDGIAGIAETFDLTITPVNDAPVAVDEELTIYEGGSPVTLNLLANDTDVDGDDLDLSFVSWPGALSLTNIDPETGSISVAVGAAQANLQAGQTAIRYITYNVADGNGGFDDATVKVTIVGVNDAPVAAALADQTSPEDAPVSFTTTAFTDADGDALTYSATLANGDALPAWLSFDAATRTFSGTPPANFNGVVSLKVTASDGSASASDTFDLTITPVNDAPTAPGLAPQSSPEDAPVNVQIAAFTDVDGDALTYSATLANGDALPAWLSFDAATRTLSGMPPTNFTGVVSLKVTASDGALSASDSFDLTIAAVNDAPTAAADAVAVNEDATTGNLVSLLLANDTDPDVGDSKSITAVGTGATKGTVTFNSATQTLTYSADHEDFDLLGVFGNPNTATDTFTYTMVDGGGLTSTATVTVTVTGVADGVKINGGSAAQRHQGGDGEDTIFGLAGNDSIYGLGGSDSLNGGSGHDIVDGGTGHDRLVGESGDDRMFGGSGRDTIWGDGGSDTIEGGAGDDVVSTGSGYDTLVFTAGQGGDRDLVTDFSSVDEIRLEDGLTLVSAVSTSDVTGDSARDTVLTLSDGHVIVLSGYTAWSDGALILA